MNLHVVAYPDLDPADYEKIQLCRKDHNSLFNIIGPHFTIVFSVPDMPLPDFTNEIKKQSAGTRAIPFHFRCAVINRDAISGNYDAFLVPDEGFSRITKLHDRLYSDKLANHHRLDISYIPHVSIASAVDPHFIKRLVDEWNKEELSIRGTISSLSVINYENRIITEMERIQLAEPV